MKWGPSVQHMSMWDHSNQLKASTRVSELFMAVTECPRLVAYKEKRFI